MASPPVGSVVGLGSTVIDRGYPFFVSEDTSGNIVTPSGHYGWNPTSNLWVPMQVDSNGVVQTALTGSNTTGAAALIAPGAMVPVLQLEGNPTLANQIGEGPGNPYVFYNPQAATTQMLFRDQPPGGSSRGTGGSLYLCNIDQNLNTSNFQQIVASTAFGSSYTGFGGGKCYWDTFNQNWIFTATLYDSNGTDTAVWFRMSPDFSTIVQTIQGISGSTSSDAPWDSGVDMVMGYDKSALLWFTTTVKPLSGEYMFALTCVKVNDFTASTWAMTAADDKHFIPLPFWNMGEPDVINVQQHRGGLLFLAETQFQSSQYNIAVGYTPQEINTSVSISDGYYFEKINPLWGDRKLVPNSSGGITNAGHPFYTDCLGFPALFFVQFRDTFGADYGPGEIWCYRLPENWLEKAIFPGSAILAQSTSSGDVWAPTFGHKSQLMAYLEAAGASTEVVVNQVSDPYFSDVVGAIPYQTTTAIASGTTQQIPLDNPAPWINASFQSNTSLTTKSRIYLHVTDK